jgi:hypothetical protein
LFCDLKQGGTGGDRIGGNKKAGRMMLKHRLSSRLAARLGVDQEDGFYLSKCQLRQMETSVKETGVSPGKRAKNKIFAVSSMSSKARRRKARLAFYTVSQAVFIFVLFIFLMQHLSLLIRAYRGFTKRLALCIEPADPA